MVRPRVLVLVSAVTLTVAACGSTVPESQRQTALGPRSGSEAGLAGGDGVADGPAALGDAPPAAGGGVAAGSGRAGTATRGGTVAAGGTRAAGAAPGVSAAPGVTDKTINVGVLYAVNSRAANSAIGAGGIDQGDDRRNTEVVVNDINSRGGVAGRKLVPVYHELDATSAETLDAQYQAACDDLTQDHKVFVTMAGGNDNFRQCMTKAGVITLEENITISDASVFRRYPYHFETASMNLDRAAALEVAALQSQNYFSGWNTAAGGPGPTKAKVGIVTMDSPSFKHAVDNVLVPALRRIGLAPDPDNIVRVPPLQRTSDAGTQGAAASSAVLRFRGSGVSHVIIFEDKAVVTLMFANAADSQGYRPRYGVNTQNGIQALIDSGAFPSSQRNGILGIGWLPGLDIAPAENTDDGPYSNDARRRCIALYKANGVTYENANAATIALGTCNTFNLFKQVMDAAPTPTRDGFVAAANRVGTGFQSASVLAFRLDADHHDAAAAYRHWGYNLDCGCMRYSSGNLPVP